MLCYVTYEFKMLSVQKDRQHYTFWSSIYILYIWRVYELLSLNRAIRKVAHNTHKYTNTHTHTQCRDIEMYTLETLSYIYVKYCCWLKLWEADCIACPLFRYILVYKVYKIHPRSLSLSHSSTIHFSGSFQFLLKVTRTNMWTWSLISFQLDHILIKCIQYITIRIILCYKIMDSIQFFKLMENSKIHTHNTESSGKF